MSGLLQLMLPAVLGFGSSHVCPMGKNIGEFIPQRPPAFVFGIVWPVLYLLIGYSLKETKLLVVRRLFAVQILLLTLWPITFSPTCLNNRKVSLFIIPLIVGLTIGIMCLQKNALAKIALIPLVSWLLVAFNLNWVLVNPI